MNATATRCAAAPVAALCLSAAFALGPILLRPADCMAADEEKKVLEVGRWYPTAEAGLNLTQASYSSNWAGGNKGSIVWAFIVNATMENQLHTRLNSLSTLKLAFGQTHQQTASSDGNRQWDRPEKSTDQLDFESIGRFTLGGFVDPFVSARFETQFLDASDPSGRSLSFNPLKFKESAGVARQLLKEEKREMLSRVGFAFRQNSRRFFAGETGNDTGSETSNDGGVEWVTDYKMQMLEKRLSWTSKLTVLKPVFFSGTDEFDAVSRDTLAAAGIDPDAADYPLTTDIDFENIFTNQISKLLSVSLYSRWVYDKYDNSVTPKLAGDGTLANAADVRKAVRKAGQFKQTLTVGLTYRFF